MRGPSHWIPKIVKPTQHVVPILRGENRASITPPWFVNGSEYAPKLATFELLVNGEQAFGEVYRAIDAATKSVSIICWGFQPSMYFVRTGSTQMIGQLLEKKARQGVMVRVLGWAWSNKPLLSANSSKAALDENNAPGRRALPFLDRPDTHSDDQYAYDRWWYSIYDRNPKDMYGLNEFVLGGAQVETLARRLARWIDGSKPPVEKLKFFSRAFGTRDSWKIHGTDYLDEGLSWGHRQVLATTTSHHQKTVVIDYENPDRALAFVMGHNMLDGYWDTNEHRFARHAEYAGRNGANPLHDYSSRVTGPIVGDVFKNFAVAWEKETGEKLAMPWFAGYWLRGSAPQAMCQILRTQPQYSKQDIMTCYLQAVANASQYILIENQYFRWPPLAERIKAAANGQTAWGRKPEQHGPLYLFVITNSSDAGMGKGTVNTYRMLESLGRADRIPKVAREQRMEGLDEQIEASEDAMKPLRSQRSALDSEARMLQGIPVRGLNERYARINSRLDPLEARHKELLAAKEKLEQDRDAQAIRPAEVPGLKVHLATLTAPDTPPGKPWPEVYIHAKLMLIDDAFMTLGSANINTRSMQADSEMNIAHHRPEITKPVREEQWARYTGGRVHAGMPLEQAFRWWSDIMKANAANKKMMRPPEGNTQLCEFLRDSPAISNVD